MKNLVILLTLMILSAPVFATEMVPTPQDSSMIYDFPEKMAQFPGGADAMDLFIRKNLNYPADLKSAGVKGKVYVQFVVEKDGSITNIQVRRSSRNDTLDQEAMNVIKKMPNWEPGTVRGKKVRVKQTIPITFNP
jgi:TonB family protein